VAVVPAPPDRRTAQGAVPRACAHPAAARPAGAASDPRHELGRRGEQLACLHLERLGFRVLERNARVRSGEIDVIAFDGATLVFAEVKTARARRRGRNGAQPLPEPLEWLDRRQRAGLRRLAAAWLADRARARPSARAIRMDAVGIVLDPSGELLRLDHVEGAF
jgi:putative endonuclease